MIINNETNWFHGVMASTLDFESSDPSSSLGGTYVFAIKYSNIFLQKRSNVCIMLLNVKN